MTFDEHVAQRMAKGAEEYGDKSWKRPKAEILAEMMEEAADFAGWCSIAVDGDELTTQERELLAHAVTNVKLAYHIAECVREGVIWRTQPSPSQATKECIIPRAVLTQACRALADGLLKSVRPRDLLADARLLLSGEPAPEAPHTEGMADRIGLEPAALAVYLGHPKSGDGCV